MRTLRIPAAVVLVTGVITRSAKDGLQNDPATAAVVRAGGASR